MASSTTTCGVCEQSNITKPSTIWCFECDEGLCSECKDHHSRSKGTRKHDTLPISEYQKIPRDIVKITDTCANHNEKFTFYCKKHDSLCCGSCIVENHMECRDFDKLIDVIQNTKLSNAFYEIEQSLAELSDNIHIIRKNRENNLGRLSKEKMQIEQAITQTRITINNHIDKIQDDIIKKLNETEVNESKIISELLMSLKENDREITEIRTKIENIKQHATDLQTFIAMKELEKRISSKDKFLQSMINSGNFKDSDLTYNPNSAMQDLANRIKNFGEVKIEKKPCNVVLTKRKDKQAQIMLPHILSRSVDNIDLKLLQTINKTGMYVRGCCMLPDGKMAFSNNSLKTVRVFNLNGTKNFQVNTRAHAFDVAYISHDNTLAVTSGESDTKCITIIDIQSKQIKKIIPVDSHYYGIAVTSEGKLICSAAGKGIQLINLHNSSITDIVRDDQIPACCYVAAFGDNIFHTSNKSKSVTCYDLQGTVEWTFQNERVLSGVRGVSVDNDGNVYVVVGESSKNVVVISTDGQQYKEVAKDSDGLFDPRCLDYNKNTNQLLVSNFSETAMTFTLI